MSFRSRKSDPKILSVETATLTGSVAVSRGATVLGVISGDAGVSHSNTLLSDIDKLLAQAHIGLPEIDLFAVATGPGSFTGLRIGIATTKALAATLDRPCSGIPTLEAVALSGGVSSATVALLPAGRGEVFAQLFSVSNELEVQALDEAAHIPPHKLLDRYGHVESLLWCGEGAIAQRQLIEEAGKTKDWRIATQNTSLAEHVASLALEKFKRSQFEDPSALRAIYVRPADAQLKVQ
jgi:tRNA threonylcarbamoyladenosine biosynthesis protein TsaB